MFYRNKFFKVTIITLISIGAAACPMDKEPGLFDILTDYGVSQDTLNKLKEEVTQSINDSKFDNMLDPLTGDYACQLHGIALLLHMLSGDNTSDPDYILAAYLLTCCTQKTESYLQRMRKTDHKRLAKILSINMSNSKAVKVFKALREFFIKKTCTILSACYSKISNQDQKTITLLLNGKISKRENTLINCRLVMELVKHYQIPIKVVITQLRQNNTVDKSESFIHDSDEINGKLCLVFEMYTHHNPAIVHKDTMHKYGLEKVFFGMASREIPDIEVKYTSEYIKSITEDDYDNLAFLFAASCGLQVFPEGNHITLNMKHVRVGNTNE